MRIERFREKLEDSKNQVGREFSFLTPAEKTAVAAEIVCQKLYWDGYYTKYGAMFNKAVLGIKDAEGQIEEGQVRMDEVERRLGLIQNSRAYKSAMEKAC